MKFKQGLKSLRLFLLGIDPGFMQLYYKLFYTPKSGSMEAFIYGKTKDIDKLKFVQIGGNDGFVKDPMFKFVKKCGWKGIIVEPQEEVFNKRLRKTYRFENNVILENLAIADKTGPRKLYKIKISNARWATGLATFNKEVLIKQIERNYVGDRAKREGLELPDNVEDYIDYEEVPCSTIHDLIDKHAFGDVQLLQIDTEGYDFEIIKTIDFTKFAPGIISFEHEHLSEGDFNDCKKLLNDAGYQLEHIERDTIAYLK